MKKLCVSLVAVFVFAATLTPSTEAAIEVSGDAYVGFYDKYLWRGYDLSGGRPVIQGGVDISGYGLTLSYWGNYQTRDAKGDGLEGGRINEDDITLDYSVDVTEAISLSVGHVFYNLDGLDDTSELYLGAALNLPLSPSLTVYYDYDEAESDGLFFNAAVGHTFELSDKLGLNLGAGIGYNQGSDYAVRSYRDWHNYELSASADYALAENLSVTPSFLFSSPISDEAKDAIDTETVAGLALTMSF